MQLGFPGLAERGRALGAEPGSPLCPESAAASQLRASPLFCDISSIFFLVVSIFRLQTSEEES